MEEGGRGAQEGLGPPRRLCLVSRHSGVRGDLARARHPCARRVLRRGGPEVAEGSLHPRGLRALFFHGVEDGARGSSEGSYCLWMLLW